MGLVAITSRAVSFVCWRSPGRPLALAALVACTSLPALATDTYFSPSHTRPQASTPYVNGKFDLTGNYVTLSAASTNTLMPFWVFPTRPGFAYLGGIDQHPYELMVRNNTARRVLAVVSVDGINVVTGESAAVNQSGYVVGPYSDVSIGGWRKSLSEVARFVFSAPERSYANRTGRAANVGVIGVAVFNEYEPPRHQDHKSHQKMENSAAESDRSTPSLPSSPGLGTEHGQREASVATTTQFRRASSQPVEVLELKYDTLPNLERMGVAQRQINPARRPTGPTPFPANGFVPDPPPMRHPSH